MEKERLAAVILGSEGASKEAYWILQALDDYVFLGFVEAEQEKIGMPVTGGQTVAYCDADLPALAAARGKLAVFLPFADGALKRRLYGALRSCAGVCFPNLIHPSAVFLEPPEALGEGNVISAGAVLACGIRMGSFNLINRCATLGHDVALGDYNCCNPGAVLSGCVTLGDGCLVGANATLLQGLRMGDGAVLGAGAVLTKDAPAGVTLAGVPARPLQERTEAEHA